MYIRPDGKCVISVVVTVEQKRLFQEMKKNGYNPQIHMRKMVEEVTETYLSIKQKNGGKNEGK